MWRELNPAETESLKPRFDTAHVAYYLGALLVIGAMGWFTTREWDHLGGPGLTAVGALYAACFTLAGWRLWSRADLRIPAGLLLTVAVCMVPLTAFGIERWTGLWPAADPGSYSRFHPYIDGSWVIMELAAIAAGISALRTWRFPFLTAPVAYALWYMSMDLPALILRRQPFAWEEKEQITTAFGAAMLFAAYVMDLRGRSDDFSFWGYLFGLAAFWGGLTSLDSNSEWSKLVYCLINLGLIGCSLVLQRRVFLVFGALGFFGYLGHLAYRVFEDSLLFPFALSGIGLAVILLGVYYQRRRTGIESRLRAALLPSIGRFLPPRLTAKN